MSKLFINALERNEKGKKVRKVGLVPGVMYLEDGSKSISIKFEKNKLENLLRKVTGASIVQVKVNNESKNCVIKDVQRDSINSQIIHLDLQSIKKGENITVRVPINFEGVEQIENKKLLLETFIPEIELSGQAEKIPENININVSKMGLGDKITSKDIELDSELDIMHDEDELFAIVVTGRTQQNITEDSSEESIEEVIEV